MLNPRRLAAVALAAAIAASHAAVAAGTEAAPAFSVPADWRLKGVVIVSRHGIRGPVVQAKCDGAAPPGNCMNAIAARPWPTYGVVAGNLIPDGYARVATLGRYYRALYQAAGVIPEKGCPDAIVRTDAMERTVMTAGALADAMFPGCGTPISIEPRLYDGPSCGYDPKKAAAAAQAFVGGSYAALANGPLRRPLAVMDAVLGPFKPDGCAFHGVAAPCSLASIPVTDSSPGAIGVADQPSEQFLMQYAAGLPANKVAWGRLRAASGKPLAAAITEVNAIHARFFAAVLMPTYQARKTGSQLMAEVLAGLDAIETGRGVPVQVYAGHDSNILNLAGLLGLRWRLPSYQPLQTPPGGAIAFELWQRPSGPAVRLVYFAQTIEQLRHNTPLSLANPPARAVMPVAGCAADHGACGWGDFRRLARRAIEPACVR